MSSHARTVTEQLAMQEIELVRKCAATEGMPAVARRLGVSLETLRKVMAGAEPVGKQTAHSVRLLCAASGGRI